VKHWEVVRSYPFDIPAFVASGKPLPALQHPEMHKTRHRLLFRQGFRELARSTNHETPHYVAMIRPVVHGDVPLTTAGWVNVSQADSRRLPVNGKRPCPE
jgi:hypothetical protein